MGLIVIGLAFLLIKSWIEPFPVGKKKLRRIIREELERQKSVPTQNQNVNSTWYKGPVNGQ